MYQAQQITDETFAQICTVIRPGMTEREIAAELIYRMLRLGAEGTSFDLISSRLISQSPYTASSI